MPAYIESAYCQWEDCTKTATKIVFNSLSCRVGCYCARHAKMEVAKLNRAESQAAKEED